MRDGGAYMYEMAIPGWNSIEPDLLRHAFQADQVIGLAVAFADFESNFDTEQPNYHAYSALNGAVELFRNADGFSDFRLLAQAAAGDPPVANFTSSATAGAVPLTVSFTDSSTDASSWHWDFGDGSSSTERNPSHTYNAAGTYTMTLTATGPGGSA